MSNSKTYLRNFYCPWPIFSTKNYVKDADGWWNPLPRRKKVKNNEQNLFSLKS